MPKSYSSLCAGIIPGRLRGPSRDARDQTRLFVCKANILSAITNESIFLNVKNFPSSAIIYDNYMVDALNQPVYN